MRKNRICYFVLAVAIFLGGCKTLPKPASGAAAVPVVAPVQLPQEERQKYDITVAVTPFIEKRLNINKYGSAYHYLIPLALYGTIRYERPEEARMFNYPEEARMFKGASELKYNMSENLAKTIAADLKKRKIFAKVIYAPTSENLDTDLILSADINSTLYEGKTYSYGISFLAPVLWCFGLPAGSSYNKLGLTFYLLKRDTKEVVWSYVLNKERSVVQGLYYHRGENVNKYVSLLEEETDKLAKDLRQKLAKVPPERLTIKPPPESPIVPAPTVSQEVSQEKKQPPTATTAVLPSQETSQTKESPAPQK